MEVTVEKSSELQRKLTVRIPSDQLEAKMDARLREIGKQVKIKGFRPGRIPPKVLRQRYGKSVRQEVVTEVVQSSLFEAIEKESLRVVSSPVLDHISDADDDNLEFTASVEVYPEIGAIDVTGLQIKRPQTEVAEADVDDMLQTLREQRRSWEDTEDKASDGHQVIIEYEAELDGRRIPERGKQRLAVVLGSDAFPELEKALKGRRPGDTDKKKLAFPAHYGESQLAGNKAKVQFEVKTVQAGQLPEIDAEFIRSFAVESGELEQLRSEVRSNLERELKQATSAYLKSQVIKQLVAQHADLAVPGTIVDQEARSIRRRAAEQQGVDVESLEVAGFVPMATNRVRSGLLLAEAARQNHIVVDGARVRRTIETVAETYEQPMEVVQMYYGNQQLLQGVENMVLEEQVVDWVVEQAKVDDVAMAFKEVINAAATAGQVS